jgi:hypothetical protein
MYASKIRLVSNSVIELPIIGALPSDRYILKSATGLGPPEVDVTITETIDAGGVYQGSRPHNRELVFLVGLNPDFAIGETAINLRSELYGLLTPGYPDATTIELIVDNMPVLNTFGYVTKLEIVPFNKDPEVQITIACTTQYWDAVSDIHVAPVLGANNTFDIYNPGTASVGMYMDLTFNASLSNWTLMEVGGKYFSLNTSFVSGDKLVIDTRPGLRAILLTHAGSTKNIMFALSDLSSWTMLHAGMNNLSTNTGAYRWNDIIFRPRYWGI